MTQDKFFPGETLAVRINRPVIDAGGALFRATIAMAHGLDMRIVAEGAKRKITSKSWRRSNVMKFKDPLFPSRAP